MSYRDKPEDIKYKQTPSLWDSVLPWLLSCWPVGVLISLFVAWGYGVWMARDGSDWQKFVAFLWPIGLFWAGCALDSSIHSLREFHRERVRRE